MKKIKQQQVLQCLSCGKYKVIDDKIFTLHKGKNEWRELKPHVLPSGYAQVTLFNSVRGKGNIDVTAYTHVVIYLANNGLYPEGWQIDHKDRDNRNCLPDNLEAKPAVDNIKNSSNNGGGAIRLIRRQEIVNIKELSGKGMSQSAIARQLNLNRLSVRYTIKQIESGFPLKYS